MSICAQDIRLDIVDIEKSIETLKDKLHDCYKCVIEQDNVCGKINTLMETSEASYSYTNKGLMRVLPMAAILNTDTKKEYITALETTLDEKGLILDTRLERITKPVMNYLMLYITPTSNSLVVCRDGKEETVAFSKEKIVSKLHAKSILLETKNRCKLDAVMVVLNDVGNVEVVT